MDYLFTLQLLVWFQSVDIKSYKGWGFTLFGSPGISELRFQATLNNGIIPCAMHFLWASSLFSLRNTLVHTDIEKKWMRRRKGSSLQQNKFRRSSGITVITTWQWCLLNLFDKCWTRHERSSHRFRALPAKSSLRSHNFTEEQSSRCHVTQIKPAVMREDHRHTH